MRQLLLDPFSFFLLHAVTSYYGYLLPNTFYAKSGFTFFHLKRGWEYFYDFLTGNLLFGLLFFIPFVLSLLRKDRILFILISFSLFFCFLITIIGGDVLPLHRLFFPGPSANLFVTCNIGFHNIALKSQQIYKTNHPSFY